MHVVNTFRTWNGPQKFRIELEADWLIIYHLVSLTSPSVYPIVLFSVLAKTLLQCSELRANVKACHFLAHAKFHLLKKFFIISSVLYDQVCSPTRAAKIYYFLRSCNLKEERYFCECLLLHLRVTSIGLLADILFCISAMSSCVLAVFQQYSQDQSTLF